MPVRTLDRGDSAAQHEQQGLGVVDRLDRVALQGGEERRLSQSLAAGSASTSSAVIMTARQASSGLT
jgi:hypothetical protein